MPSSEEWIVIVVSVIIILALIVFFVVLVWAKESKRWIFAPYVQPDIVNGYRINGEPKELTKDEQENRRKLIEAALKQSASLKEQSTFDVPLTTIDTVLLMPSLN